MSRIGTPTDNPIIESKNGWLKKEMFIDFNLNDYETIEEFGKKISLKVFYGGSIYLEVTMGNSQYKLKVYVDNEELVAKDTYCTGSGPVSLLCSFCRNSFQQVKILFHAFLFLQNYIIMSF